MLRARYVHFFVGWVEFCLIVDFFSQIISSGEAVVMVPKILITTPPQVPALPSKL
jgi:hypothetical protein